MNLFLKQILPQLGTLASLIGLIISIKPSKQPFNDWHWFLIILFISFFILSIFIYFKNKPLVFKSKEDVKEYMYKWIKNGGRTAIFSRNLSWIDEEMNEMLKTKAKNNQLIICLPNNIPKKTKEFKKLGAEIIEYSNLNYTPQSRFTITNFGTTGAKVAVGKITSKGNNFSLKIEEFNNGNHPYFHIADDVIKLLRNNKL